MTRELSQTNKQTKNRIINLKPFVVFGTVVGPLVVVGPCVVETVVVDSVVVVVVVAVKKKKSQKY